ncbi:MAG: sensor histidine kinase [Anaerolineae bacterium]
MRESQDHVQELQAALEEAQAALQAERANHQAFVSLIVHELRIPMTSIKGYADLLLKEITGPLNAAQVGLLETIRANVERMSKMVDDLSELNKLDGGRLHLSCEPVAVKEILREALAPLEAELAEKSHEFELSVLEELPPAWGDKQRLVRIMRALLHNAIQYTQPRGRITVRARPDPDQSGHILITVSDTGIGIPSDEQDRIFEPFFRASDEATRERPGNGLSLHLSKRLVEMHHGTLTFDSQQGRGSTFCVRLPTAQDRTAP